MSETKLDHSYGLLIARVALIHTEGLENVPTAFGGIFSGANFGKTVVKVS
jgi:NADPH-dependent curcumin reductase CurA